MKKIGSTKQHMSISSPLLHILTRSEYRKDLLFYIEKAPRSQSEINEHFQVTSPEIQPRLKEMEAVNLISKHGGFYEITLFGKIISSYYKPFLDTITAMESNNEFWENHDLSAIPEELLYRIQELKDCIIAKIEDYKICVPHVKFVNMVKKATKIKGITHVFNPMWVDLLLTSSNSGAMIDIIMTQAVFSEIKTKYENELNEGLKNKNAHIYVCQDNLKLAFSTMECGDDQLFSLALNYINGRYDNNSDLEGADPTSIKWGDDLLNIIRKNL